MITDQDREYASELLADLKNNFDGFTQRQKAAEWFRKARLEQQERNGVIIECAEIARQFEKKYDDQAGELFKKEGEWRARHKSTAADEIAEAILALAGNKG